MADFVFIDERGLKRRFKEMGDGTFAEVLSVTVAADSNAGALPNGTDRSSFITTGGSQQTLAPANALRKSLSGQNISSADLWINEMGNDAAPDTAGSYRVAAGGMFNVATARKISVWGVTTGQKFTATET